MSDTIFAQGLCFEKIFFVFVTGAIIGDLAETVFCRIKMKKWMSRSSFVYGQFSIVWGMAMVIATLLFYRVEQQGIFVVFVSGVILGGIYEYLCSLISEKCFGVIFWDYSKMPINIAGRVNGKYCLYWGAAALLWVYMVFPVLEKKIEQIPADLGNRISQILFCFVAVDAVISALALKRYVERNKEGSFSDKRKNCFWSFIDNHFPDERMKKVYPCMKMPKTEKMQENAPFAGYGRSGCFR